MTHTQLDAPLSATRTLGGSPDEPLTAEPVVRRLIDERFGHGSLDVCDELISEEIAEHQDYGPNHAPGAAGVKAVVTSLRRAFSDFKLEIEDLVVSGNTVWTRNIATGTHDGLYMGHAPSGRGFRIYVFDVLRVVDSRVVEHWGVPDRVAVLTQLGLLSRPRGAGTGS